MVGFPPASQGYWRKINLSPTCQHLKKPQWDARFNKSRQVASSTLFPDLDSESGVAKLAQLFTNIQYCLSVQIAAVRWKIFRNDYFKLTNFIKNLDNITSKFMALSIVSNSYFMSVILLAGIEFFRYEIKGKTKCNYFARLFDWSNRWNDLNGTLLVANFGEQ